MTNNIKNMETMSIPKLAIKTSIPMVISMISIALYGIIDTIFVSGISEKALTAITLAYPIQNIITSIGLGTGIGINSLLARTLGEKDNEKVKKIINNGISLNVVLWIAIALIFSFFSKPMMSFFTNDIEIINLSSIYLIILSVFSVGTLFQIFIEKILEAYGNTKESMIIQIIGSVINLILDPILIYGAFSFKGLGIMGAAIATIIGQIIGMIIGVRYMFKFKLINIDNIKYNLKMDKNIIREIYVVGIPTIILEIVSSFIMLWINKILIDYSEAAVTVWGVYGKIDKFVLITIYGLNYGMIPILAYNLGAKRKDRIDEALSFFAKVVFVITLIGTIVVISIPSVLLQMFDISKETLELGCKVFRILSMGFVFAGMNMMLSAVFQAFGNANYSLIVKLLRKLFIVMPIIYIFKNIFGMEIIWWSFLIAEVITLCVAIILFRKLYNKEINKIKEKAE